MIQAEEVTVVVIAEDHPVVEDMTVVVMIAIAMRRVTVAVMKVEARVKVPSIKEAAPAIKGIVAAVTV